LREGGGLRLLLCVGVAVAAAAVATPAAAQVGGGQLIVKLKGVVAAKHVADKIASLTLSVKGQNLSFAVTSVHRLNGPGEGRSLLNPLGPAKAPWINVVGEDSLLATITGAKPGTALSLEGVLSYQPAYLQLTSAKVASGTHHHH